MANENLSRPFLIEFNGQFVVNPPPNAERDFGGRVPASVGGRPDAAVFLLEDGILRSVNRDDNPLQFLGRFVIEPLAFMPMPVYWMPQRDQVKRCIFTGDESSPQVFKSEGILDIGYMVIILESDYK